MSIRFAALIGCIILPLYALAANDESEISQFQGDWKVIQLVENGQVIPAEAIKEWLPSGGLAQISDNAIMFKSSHDGQSHVKLFSIDATQYPKGIDIRSREKTESQGIYRFDNGRLIICFSDPATNERPTTFSAVNGSNRMLMTLARTSAPAKSPPTALTVRPKEPKSEAAAKVLTDVAVKQLLVGVWRFSDSIGPLLVTINADGTFTTSRDVAEIRLFQTVFSRRLESTGTWNVQNSQLVYHIASSMRVERSGLMVALHVRSISTKDLIFVDGLGRVGTAVKAL
jgi:uncharacterized protein (TIGR03067 family)